MLQYGPETSDARGILQRLIESRLERGWTIETRDDQSAGRASVYKQIETVQGRLRAAASYTPRSIG
jgi:hypothetical protein